MWKALGDLREIQRLHSGWRAAEKRAPLANNRWDGPLAVAEWPRTPTVMTLDLWGVLGPLEAFACSAASIGQHSFLRQVQLSPSFYRGRNWGMKLPKSTRSYQYQSRSRPRYLASTFSVIEINTKESKHKSLVSSYGGSRVLLSAHLVHCVCTSCLHFILKNSKCGLQWFIKKKNWTPSI